MEQSEETKKNFSEMSFLNEDLDEEDGKQSEAEPVPTNIHLKEVEVEDPRISEIINSGVREFQSDYLQKIDAAFQLQVDQMTKIFSNGLAKAHVSFEQQLDKELDNIRKDYANRIIEFDNTTTYYKDSNEVVLTETKKYEEAMAAKILALQLHVQEVEETLQTELKNIVQDEERKLREQRAKEKLEQHEELLESSNMATNRRWVLEEEYKQEIQALEAQSEKLEVRIVRRVTLEYKRGLTPGILYPRRRTRNWKRKLSFGGSMPLLSSIDERTFGLSESEIVRRQ